jgi:hypothetical protein
LDDEVAGSADGSAAESPTSITAPTFLLRDRIPRYQRSAALSFDRLRTDSRELLWSRSRRWCRSRRGSFAWSSPGCTTSTTTSATPTPEAAAEGDAHILPARRIDEVFMLGVGE